MKSENLLRIRGGRLPGGWTEDEDDELDEAFYPSRPARRVKKHDDDADYDGGSRKRRDVRRPRRDPIADD